MLSFTWVNPTYNYPIFLCLKRALPSFIFHPLDIHNLSRKLITNNSKGDRTGNFFCWIKSHICRRVIPSNINKITKILRMGRKILLATVFLEPHRMKILVFFWLLNIFSFSMTRNYGYVGFHLVQPNLQSLLSDFSELITNNSKGDRDENHILLNKKSYM